MWIYLDKPEGIRSVPCLNIIKKAINVKCGIWGILDEFASGLLPIATESDTKNIDKYNDQCKKQYIFTVQWGQATDTGDLTGQIIETSDHRPNQEDILKIIPQFIGSITQIPPVFSNIKINGTRAHQLARQGVVINMPPRIVQIYSLELLESDGHRAKFSVWVGHGTYIRSLAMDIGKTLGTCGHLIQLRREAIEVNGSLIYPNVSMENYGWPDNIHSDKSQ